MVIESASIVWRQVTQAEAETETVKRFDMALAYVAHD